MYNNKNSNEISTFEVRILPDGLACGGPKVATFYKTMADLYYWELSSRKPQSLFLKENPHFDQACSNIYQDHCIYSGGRTTDLRRRKDMVCIVNGFMIDIDSHSESDMPLDKILGIVGAPSFQAAVPFLQIVHTGHGVQIHFASEKQVPADPTDRAKAIRDYESGIWACAMKLKADYGLQPDKQCKEINRLFRVPGTWNTKAMANPDDVASRIQAKIIAEKSPSADETEAFISAALRELNDKPDPPTKPSSTGLVNAPDNASGYDLDPAADTSYEPPCIQQLATTGAPQGKRNQARFVLISRWRKQKLTDEQIEERLHGFNDKCQPPDSLAELNNHLRQFSGQGETRCCGCKYIRDQLELCRFQQDDLDTARAKCRQNNPIHTTRHPYIVGLAGNMMRKEPSPTEGAPPKLSPITQRGSLIVKRVIEKGPERFYTCEITSGQRHITFEAPSALWAAASTKFGEFIKGKAGDDLIFSPRDADHLARASELLESNKIYLAYRDFGLSDDFGDYYGRHCVISKDGILPADKYLFAGNHKSVSKLGIHPPESHGRVTDLLGQIRNELWGFNDPEVMQLILGMAFITPFHSLFRKCATTTNAIPSIIIQGTTGTGKTTQLVLASCFFGRFRESDVISFSATPKLINDLGHEFKDALYVVDDLKWGAMSQGLQSSLVQMLQAYVDGHGRDRLVNANGSGEWTPSTGKEIRGTMCISGEDLPTGEASILGRFMVTSIRQANRNSSLLSRCLDASSHYSQVMAAYLAWHFRQPDAHDYLISHFDKLRKDFERSVPPGAVNAVRVCSQLALNLLGYIRLTEFMRSYEILPATETTALQNSHHSRLCSLQQERLLGIQNETPVEKFLGVLKQLLASKRVSMVGASNSRSLPEIGIMEFEQNQAVLYLVPDVAFAEVQRALATMNDRIPFSQQSLGHQFRESGYLVRTESGRCTITKTINGTPCRTYALNASKIGLPQLFSAESTSEPGNSTGSLFNTNGDGHGDETSSISLADLANNFDLSAPNPDTKSPNHDLDMPGAFV